MGKSSGEDRCLHVVEGHSAELRQAERPPYGEAHLETGSREGFTFLRQKMRALSKPLGTPQVSPFRSGAFSQTPIATPQRTPQALLGAF